MAQTSTPVHRNEIVLVGRVTTAPVERELPSGDTVSSLRVTIDRAGEPGRFDVVDCTAWSARLQRTVLSWTKGDVVEISGALRRRFWRTGAGAPASAYDVELHRARRVLAVTRPRTRE